MTKPRNKLSSEGLHHAHKVAMQSLRMSFPGQQRYRDGVLLIYMVEACLGHRIHPGLGESVRRRYPAAMFEELDHG